MAAEGEEAAAFKEAPGSLALSPKRRKEYGQDGRKDVAV